MPLELPSQEGFTDRGVRASIPDPAAASHDLADKASSILPATSTLTSQASSTSFALLRLPPEITERIALSVALQDSLSSLQRPEAPQSASNARNLCSPPKTLLHLLLTCRALHDHLRVSQSPRLYAQIFEATFDSAALTRRFGRAVTSATRLAHELRRRYQILKRIRRAVSLGRLKPEDEEACAQRNLKEHLWLVYLMLLENDGRNKAALQWAGIKGYLALFHQELLESALEPGYPPANEDKALAMHIDYLLLDPTDLAAQSKDQAEEKLFVLRPFVFASHKYEGFYAPWTLKALPLRRLEDSKHAMEEVEKARGATAPLMAAAREAEAASSSVLGQRPGSTSGAPPESVASMLADGDAQEPPNPFMADLAPRVRSTTITHCGQTLTLRPPILAHAAYFMFFMLVESAPDVVELTAITGRGAEPGTVNRRPNNDGEMRPPTQLGLLHPSLSGGRVGEVIIENSEVRGKSILGLQSEDHDQDLTRLMACHNPYASIGLRPCFFKTTFTGTWEGRFCFFDFNSYREMLAGRMQSLYEGPFGEQPQVWKLKEHFVRVGEGHRQEGGNHSVIGAGYGPDEPVEELLQQPRTLEEARENSRQLYNGKRRADGEDKQTSGRSFSGHRNDRPSDYEAYPQFDEEDGGISAGFGHMDGDASGERYEMLISGIGHSAWGRFVLRGRVRAWDGMLLLCKEYKPEGRGRWLYRGYSVAGQKLVGRWRDSFTPGDLSGYEGPFSFQKRLVES